MKLPSVVISGGTLSDIWFNFEHPTLEAAKSAAEDGLSDTEWRAALMEDARDFAKMLDFQVSEGELVEDFMGRL